VGYVEKLELRRVVNGTANVGLDASKVPPSQFQRRKGSIYSTPSSRDSHHNNTERDKAYHTKLKEKVCSCFRRLSCVWGANPGSCLELIHRFVTIGPMIGLTLI
jgi:hypothetical protein